MTMLMIDNDDDGAHADDNDIYDDDNEDNEEVMMMMTIWSNQVSAVYLLLSVGAQCWFHLVQLTYDDGDDDDYYDDNDNHQLQMRIIQIYRGFGI